MNNQFQYKPIALAILIALPLMATAEVDTIGNVSQTAINSGPVSNSNTDNTAPTIGVTDTGMISLGSNSSVSVGATGAAASVSISTLNAPLPVPSFVIPGVDPDPDVTVEGINNIDQAVTNTGSISNNGRLVTDMNTFETVQMPVGIDLNGGSLGVGAATSVSATGAAASVSVSAINDGSYNSDGILNGFNLPTLGNVTQAGGLPGDVSGTIYAGFINAPIPRISNTGAVTNNGAVDGVGAMDIGSAVSIRANGAIASFSVSAVSVEQIEAEYVAPINVVAANLGSVVQSAQNTGSINNDGLITFAANSEMSTATSASVSATGAAVSVSYALVNANLVTESGWTIGDILQGSNNTGSVTNTGSITGVSTDLGQAASAAVSATGAVAAVSFSGVNNSLTLPNVASGFDVSQFVSNEGAVTNAGTISSLGTLGFGASAAVSATGAAASFSFSGNNATLNATTTGSVAQTAVNDAAVSNSGEITAGALRPGASAAISATGAVASLAFSANYGSIIDVRDGYNPQLTGATQTVTNLGTVSNIANTEEFTGVTVGTLDTGASASVTATGAAAVISISRIVNVNDSDSVSRTGNYVQTVTNGAVDAAVDSGIGDVSNSGIVSASYLDVGASVSVSATGAVASMSESAIYSGVKFSTVSGTIDQTVKNYGVISNNGKVTTGNLGAAASASVSATGAVASVSTSAVGGTVLTPAYIGFIDEAVNQTVTNTGDVSNTAGVIGGVTGVYTGELIASGASASISSSGAVASTTFSVIDGTFTTRDSGNGLGALGPITQTVTNADSGEVTNVGNMQTGALSGNGASASISATGAVASTSFNMNSVVSYGSTFFDLKSETQNVTNNGNVTNTGSMTTDVLSGNGASASISASGAVASTAFSTNSSTLTENYARFQGAITQNAENYGDITNTGSLSLGGLSGKGASASISATGAASSFSVASIADSGVSSIVLGSAFSQTAANGAAVSNNGTINFGSSAVTLANGASAAVSATGAATSISFSNVK
jgi:hypothetical protein